MKFLLARHAEAESGPQMDPTRALTPTGEKQIPIMADFLNAMDCDIGLILHSDMARGRDTAEGIAKLLEVDTAQDPAVGPEVDAEGNLLPGAESKAWRVIQVYARQIDDDEILLVISHDPLIAALTAWLLQSGEGDKFHFSHGTICKFGTEDPEIDSDRGANLAYMHWMATAKLMKRAMKHDPELIESALRVADAALELGGVHLDEKGEYTYEEVLKKRVTEGNSQSGPCDDCEDNIAAGWIDSEDVYPSGDDAPPFHPNCVCEEEYKESRVRVYESGLRVVESERMVLREDGGWVTIRGHRVDLGTSEGNLSDKQKRAIAACNPARKAEQKLADHSEKMLNKALGIPRTPDNSAFDLQNDAVGIEIKTMISNKNDKITMSKAAIGRKIAEQDASDIKTYTVVADRRTGGYKSATYYVKEGFGSFQLSSMTKISISDLKTMVKKS